MHIVHILCSAYPLQCISLIAEAWLILNNGLGFFKYIKQIARNTQDENLQGFRFAVSI